MTDTIKNLEVQALSQALTAFEQSVVLAAAEPRIKALERLKINKKVTDVVSRAFMTLGANALQEPERVALEKLIYDDLKLSYPNLTLKEFEIAVYKGSMGEFKKKPDEVLFISPEKIHSWIKCYLSDIKKEAVAKQRAFEAEQDKVKVKTEAEIKEIELAFLSHCVIAPWKNFKTVGVPVQDPVNAIYNALDKLGLIPFTDERKREIYKQAEEQFRVQAKSVSSVSEAREANKLIAKLERGDSSIQSRVKCLAKQIALEIYLNDLNEMEVDLEELIKEKL
jgi:hypothetical protein